MDDVLLFNAASVDDKMEFLRSYMRSMENRITNISSTKFGTECELSMRLTLQAATHNCAVSKLFRRIDLLENENKSLKERLDIAERELATCQDKLRLFEDVAELNKC